MKSITERNDPVYWDWICHYNRNLSEDFISKNKEYVNWSIICEKHTLSEEFMIEHQEYLDWDAVLMNQKLSEQFVIRFVDYLL